MRTLTALLISLILGLYGGTPAHAATRHRDMADREKHCRFGSLEHARWSVREVRLTIACAEHRWSVAGGLSKALAVAACESGFAWFAHNASGATGIFQQLARFWPGRLAEFRHTHPAWRVGPSAFNGRSNVLVSIHQASVAGWGGWSCA